jgi:hypothetical protein
MLPRTAIVIRRAAILGAALAATVSVHVVSTGHLAVTPVAPVIWIGMIAAVMPLLAVRAPATVTARSPVVLLGILLVAQAALHAAMSAAPWAFGLVEHHELAPATPAALAAHMATAVTLALLLSFGERILAAAVAVAQAILSIPPVRPRRARPLLGVPFSPLVLVTRSAGRPSLPRGPPRPAPGFSRAGQR